MKLKIIDEKSRVSVKVFAETFSKLPPEAQEVAYHTINGMVLLSKAQEIKKRGEEADSQ